MLCFEFYVLGNLPNGKTYGEEKSYGGRVKQLYDKSKIENLICVELARKKGQLLITSKYALVSLVFPSDQNIIASVEAYLWDRIQYAVSHQGDDDVYLVHLNFQPKCYCTSWVPKLCKVSFEGTV